MKPIVAASLRLTAVFLLAMQPLSFGYAQSSNPAWLDELGEQLAKERQCMAEYYVKTREGELGGRPFQEARVQCRDGRQFDADRISPEPLFTIKKCKPVVC